MFFITHIYYIACRVVGQPIYQLERVQDGTVPLRKVESLNLTITQFNMYCPCNMDQQSITFKSVL